MLPIIAFFVLFFLYLIQQKKNIIVNIKNNEDLRTEFMKTLNVHPPLNENDESSFVDVELLFNEIIEKESANDFLTPKNFVGKSFLKV